MATTVFLLLSTVFFLAYSNGANDNVKSVATLIGSGTINFSQAIWWASLTTLAGSITAIFIAQELITTFTGKGLVPHVYTAQLPFLVAVTGGAALTVMFATLGGIPISTTHALMGALMGSGLILAGEINITQMWSAFFAPMVAGPLLAIMLTIILYQLLHYALSRLGVEYCLCICIEGREEAVVPAEHNILTLRSSGMDITVADIDECRLRYFLNGQTTFVGFEMQRIVDTLHFLSAGLVGFARSLNDTPKIVALLMAAKISQVSLSGAMIAVGLTMVTGGLLSARKVAKTMSHEIVPMTQSQGFVANFVTASLVIIASRMGMPLSTTHVSVGSLFGLGLISGKGRWPVISSIVAAWFITLPVAAMLAAMIAHILS